MATYYTFDITGYYTGSIESEVPVSLGTLEIPPECPPEHRIQWQWPGWLAVIEQYIPDPEPIEPPINAKLVISVVDIKPVHGKYVLKAGSTIKGNIEITPACTQTFFLPLEHEGSATIPVPVSVTDGRGVVETKLTSPGFYRVTYESVNREIPDKYKMDVETLTIVVLP